MKTFMCENCMIEVPQYTPMIIPYCPECGNISFMVEVKEKTPREQALEWWNSFSGLQQTQYCDTNTELIGSVRRRETLTGREIEDIWRKENPITALPNEMINTDFDGIEKEHSLDKEPQQEETYETDGYKEACRAEWEDFDNEESERGVVTITIKEEPKVNFKDLISLIDVVELVSITETCFEGAKKDIDNMKLFFKLLSTKPTFAKKAHQELNKLNK